MELPHVVRWNFIHRLTGVVQCSERNSSAEETGSKSSVAPTSKHTEIFNLFSSRQTEPLGTCTYLNYDWIFAATITSTAAAVSHIVLQWNSVIGMEGTEWRHPQCTPYPLFVFIYSSIHISAALSIRVFNAINNSTRTVDGWMDDGRFTRTQIAPPLFPPSIQLGRPYFARSFVCFTSSFLSYCYLVICTNYYGDDLFIRNNEQRSSELPRRPLQLFFQERHNISANANP